jgi:adenylate kinase family enzyme
VAVPEDAAVEATVYETIAARTGRPAQVMWVVGGPGSGREQQVAQVSKKFDLEVIDVDTLLSVSEASGSQYGQVITDCRVKGTAIPTHIVVNLVKDALLSSGLSASRFLVNNFPQTMDQALMFEQVIGEVSALVCFDRAHPDLQWDSRDKSQTEEQSRAIQNYKLEVRPVIDHYALHNKLKKISTEGSASQVAARLKKVFA